MFFRYTDNNKTDVQSASVVHTSEGTFDSAITQVAPTGWTFANDLQSFVSMVEGSITMRQCRLQLTKMGIYDQVDTAVKSIGGTALIEWEYASELLITNPLVAQIAIGLGLSDVQVTTLFNEASLL